MIVLIMLLLNLICWGCLGVWISFLIPHSVLSGNYIKGNCIFALNQIETVDILQNDTIYQIFSIHSEMILITKIPIFKKSSQCIKYLANFQLKWSCEFYGSPDGVALRGCLLDAPPQQWQQPPQRRRRRSALRWKEWSAKKKQLMTTWRRRGAKNEEEAGIRSRKKKQKW